MEAQKLFTDTISGKERRTYLDYSKIKSLRMYQDRWKIFDEPELPVAEEEKLWRDFSAEHFLKGYGDDEPDYTLADIKEANKNCSAWREK